MPIIGSSTTHFHVLHCLQLLQLLCKSRPLDPSLYNWQVSVSLAESTDFLAVPVGKEEESYCICVNERKTVAWAVTPRSLGKRPDDKKILGSDSSVWHQISGVRS